MSSRYLVSVIVPVKNGGPMLEKCLESLFKQTISHRLEIIVLDSMSNDGSKEIALKYNAKIINIPDTTFNHGLTRNIGVQHASASLVYFTVQDAYLPENNILEKMAFHFQDTTVQAVVGQQVVPWGHTDKNPVKWFKRYTDPGTEMRHFPLPEQFDNFPSKKQFELSNWDNVIAMYRRISLIDIPFRETKFSEDWIWANEALKSGLKILRDTSLITYHYHHMYFKYCFVTKFIVNYHFYKFFKQLPKIPWSPWAAAKESYIIIKRRKLSMLEKPYWIKHNLLINLATFLSVFIFRFAFLFGKDKSLDIAYEIFCKKIPQGRQSFKQ